MKIEIQIIKIRKQSSGMVGVADVSGFQFVSEKETEEYYSKTEDEHYFKPTDKISFFYGVKFLYYIPVKHYLKN
jgi:hypothetical protein